MDRLASMAIFVTVVERGSFAAAAEEVRISSTMVGVHVRALEARLGARLLNRTTRRQSLTEVGRIYYARCKQILADVEEADASAERLQAQPRGLLRVAAPVSFGVHALVPALADYMAAHPQVEIELSLNDRVVDLLEEGFEAAIRIGNLPDSSLLAQPLLPYGMAVCAAPDYLAHRGLPLTPPELANHDCLGFSQWSEPDVWRFTGPEGSSAVRVNCRLRINNGEALRMAARNGLGVIMQPAVLLEEDLRTGRLTPILQAFVPPARPVHLLYLPDRPHSAKLRTFIQFVAARFARRSD